MSNLKSESDSFDFPKKPKMLRVASSSMTMDDQCVGGRGYKEDTIKNMEHETRGTATRKHMKFRLSIV